MDMMKKESYSALCAMERQAVQIFIILMSMILEGRLVLVNSFALQYENSKNPKIENKAKLKN